MLVAFSIAPSSEEPDGGVSEAVARAVGIVRASGLPNHTDSMFTTLEGEWDECMAVIKECVDVLSAESPRVSLVLKADIRPGFTGQLEASAAGRAAPDQRVRRVATGGRGIRAAAVALGGAALIEGSRRHCVSWRQHESLADPVRSRLDAARSVGRPGGTMSSQPFSRASLHGAVDLSGLKQQQVQAAMSGGQGTSAGGTAPGQAAPGAAAQGDQPGGQPGAHDPRATVVAVDLDTFGAVLQDSAVVPAVLVLWSPQIPGALEYVQMMERLAIEFEGRFRLATGNVAAQPEMLQAFQIPELPEAMTIAVMMGQPMPLYAGAQPEEEVRAVMQNLLQAAAQNGVTGRAQPGVSGSVSGEADGPGEQADQGEQPGQPQEEPLSPHVQAAYDAIDAGDFAAAVAAFDARLAEEPGDEEARLGRQQVVLLERAGSLDATAVREAAAKDATDIEAQMQAADLDLMGGHVEDAFGRLIDTVKVTADDDRNAVRERLLELFEMVGSADPRVRTARSQLMSALF
ncbi:hypothetical protein BJF82_01005 [Kytococcus sp. CUA-901]|nr:hypothetical protein BJF82_01005 [Kytococcus sp. CUA-901]